MGVGQMSDPKDVPGLAHFLEHMLFLGSSKYPGDDTYSKTLAELGGRSNAYTALEDTNYFFDVGADGLETVLDIFAQFFIDPLFTADATARELNAVHSEHEKNLQADIWREMQLMRTTSDQDYAYAKFGTGSKETLEEVPASLGIDLRDELLKFHAEYYSASIATVAILGKQTLDQLEDLVRTTFSPIPSTGRTRPVHVPSGVVDPLNTARLPFGDNGVGQWFSVVPVRDIRKVTLKFPILPLVRHYRTRPDALLGHLFGHESEGSILAALKARSWATSLMAGKGGMATDDFAFFSVTVTLTEEGEAHLEEVIDMVFAYAGVLRSAGVASLGPYFEELVSMGKVSFQAKEKSDPMKTVLGIAQDLQIIEPEVVLAHSTLFLDAFDAEATEAILNALTPTNVRILHISPSVAGKTDANEKWYGTEYEQHVVEPETTQRWEAFLQSGEAGASLGLALPESNSFIPDDLSIKRLVSSDPEAYAPSLVADTPLLKLWHKQDNVYHTPKASVCLTIRAPSVYASPRAVVLSVLAINMIKEELNAFAYMAEIAGLSCVMSYDPMGIQIQIHGYNQKLGVLLERVVSVLAAPDMSSEDVFRSQKEKTKRAYLNARNQQPYMHAFEAVKALLVRPEWSSEQKLAVIDSVSLQDVAAHAQTMLSQFAIEGLVHGNITPEDALTMVSTAAQVLSDAFGTIPLEPELKPERRVVALAASRTSESDNDNDGPVVVARPGPNEDDVNSALYSVFQLGLSSPEVDVQVALLAQVLKQPAFQILRTEQQLGYIVDVGPSEMENVRGIRAVIQSSVKHPGDLDAALTDALASISASLASLDDEAFARHVDAVRLTLSERDKRLAQETNRFWAEISKSRYVFDRVDRQLAYLDTVTKDALLDLLSSTVSSPRARASGWIFGKAHADEYDQAMGVDPLAFASSSFLYPSSS